MSDKKVQLPRPTHVESIHGSWVDKPQYLDHYLHDVARDGESWEAIYGGEPSRWIFSHGFGLAESNLFEQLLLKRILLMEEEYIAVCAEEEPLAEWEKDLMSPLPSDLEVNPRGGKQSKLETRFDLVPPAALHEVAFTLHEGAQKYGDRNWRKIDPMSHLNHALTHLNNYRAMVLNNAEFLNTSEIEELAHAATRLLMALEIELVGEDE